MTIFTLMDHNGSLCGSLLVKGLKPLSHPVTPHPSTTQQRFNRLWNSFMVVVCDESYRTEHHVSNTVCVLAKILYILAMTFDCVIHTINVIFKSIKNRNISCFRLRATPVRSRPCVFDHCFGLRATFVRPRPCVLDPCFRLRTTPVRPRPCALDSCLRLS